MGSSSLRCDDQLKCLIRQEWVAATPEEYVRQKLLIHMTEQLGFPKGQLGVEVSLKALPHLSLERRLPRRRADIVCFAPKLHPIYGLHPLLLVECKAISLTETVRRQLTGYNSFIRAPFVCLANQHERWIGRWNEALAGYDYTRGLAPYSQLVDSY